MEINKRNSIICCCNLGKWIIKFEDIKSVSYTHLNQDIQSFIDKTNEVLESENQNIIYTVDYVANIQEDILSLMIRSNLKEGSNAQRVIIETYNYDLRNNKEISLEEVLAIEYVDKNEVQNRIDTKIAEEQRQVEDLKELGYNIYNRDTSSEQYKVDVYKRQQLKLIA